MFRPETFTRLGQLWNALDQSAYTTSICIFSSVEQLSQLQQTLAQPTAATPHMQMTQDEVCETPK